MVCCWFRLPYFVLPSNWHIAHDDAAMLMSSPTFRWHKLARIVPICDVVQFEVHSEDLFFVMKHPLFWLSSRSGDRSAHVAVAAAGGAGFRDHQQEARSTSGLLGMHAAYRVVQNLMHHSP
jgi:hypothetical protein